MKNMLKLFIVFLFFGGCSTNRDKMSFDDSYLYKIDSLLTVNNMSNEPLISLIDSIYILQTKLDQQEIVVEILNNEIDTMVQQLDNLDEKNSQITSQLELALSISEINTGFKLPDTVIFAGYKIDISSDRILEKITKIYNNELKYAHKYIPRSGYYFPLFEKVFKEYNVPEDAKYLAVAESSLNPLAHSWAGADGIWQFMPKTGIQYGMKINSYLDERRNILVSTKAAAKYLVNSRKYLGKYGSDDWLLAMCAYNAGVGNIAKVIKVQGGKSFEDLIMKSDETNQYVWRAIAIKLIFENQQKIFGKSFEKKPSIYETMRTAKIKTNGYHKLDKWAIAQGTNVRDIWLNNHWIKIYKLKRNKYTKINNIILPSGNYEVLINKEAIPNSTLLASANKNFLRKGTQIFTYVVRKGDNLGALALRFRTSVASIKSINRIRGTRINIGQRLKINVGRSYVATKTGYYRVRKGDSLIKIAKKFKMYVSTIKSMNALKSSKIKVGQLLKIKLNS